MGISTNFYTVWGIKIDWDEGFSEDYSQVFNDKDTPYTLFEGYDCEYMVFGEVLYDSGDMRWGFEDGDSFKEIELDKLPEYEKSYKEEFIKKFPNYAYIVDKPFKLMTFVHYS